MNDGDQDDGQDPAASDPAASDPAASSQDDAVDAARWAAVEGAVEKLMDGEHTGALAELRAVLENDGQNAYAFRYAGAALFELDQLEAARDAYRAAVSMSPLYLGAHVGLVHTLRLCEDADAAVRHAKKTLELFPHDADAMYALGLALAARGERREAVRALTRFLASNPELEVQLETKGIIDMLNQEPDGEPLVWK